MKSFQEYITEAFYFTKIDHSKFPNPLPRELWSPFFEMGLKDGNMKDDVVGAKPHTWSANELNPTQNDVYLSKSLSMAMGSRARPGVEGGNLKSVVSYDGYILDGHHRWAATMLNNPDAKISGIRIALKIYDLVPILRAAGDAFGNARRGAPKGDRNIFDSTIEDAMDAIENGKGMNPQFQHGSSSKFYDKSWAMEWLSELGGERVLAQRIKEIQSHKTPSNSPERKDMPVIDADKLENGLGQEENVAMYLRKGMIDIRKPYST